MSRKNHNVGAHYKLIRDWIHTSNLVIKTGCPCLCPDKLPCSQISNEDESQSVIFDFTTVSILQAREIIMDNQVNNQTNKKAIYDDIL